MSADTPKRILVLGATGTIGRAVVRALSDRGHSTVSFVRSGAGADALAREVEQRSLAGVTIRTGNPIDRRSLAHDGFCGERFDAILSCLASRTGAPDDAWAIDYQAHVDALAAAIEAHVPHMILLSALCVQKPKLEFQRAKLAFEKALIESGIAYSIVRPTAFFKSLSGQVERVKSGKPFLVFGDGNLTACKPISDADLARYMISCLEDATLRNRILPIGGPGEPMTPRQQGEMLFALLGREPRLRQLPAALLDVAVRVLSALGTMSNTLSQKAELARIGRYYATESMLLWDEHEGRYDAAATLSFGTETLRDFYARLLKGEASVDRGDHAVF